jgi:ribulose-phosphate 3-epimerase
MPRHTSLIFPSLANTDKNTLQHTINQLDDLCTGYHIDVMDGEFVPHKKWDIPAAINEIENLEHKTLHTLWIHLMVTDPAPWIEKLTIEPFSIITFHTESKAKIKKTINDIKEKKWLPSLAINPKTDIGVVFPFLADLHQVLLMSVEPGFSGQEFLKDTLSKLDRLVGFRQTSGLDFKIAMDGGIDEKNIGMLAERGVNHFGIGSGIFDTQNPVKALKELNTIVSKIAQ